MKDFVCTKGGVRWVAGVYFSRSKCLFSAVKKKFLNDALGVDKNNADAFAFVTNQELTLSQREKLSEEVAFDVELYHLERISTMLNSAPMYGVRLEFLGIEMTKEEQLSFVSMHEKILEQIQSSVGRD